MADEELGGEGDGEGCGGGTGVDGGVEGEDSFDACDWKGGERISRGLGWGEEGKREGERRGKGKGGGGGMNGIQD